MDDDGLNMSNWGYYDPAVRIPLSLQLKSPSMADREIRDLKPLFSELDTTGVMSSMEDREIQDVKPLFSELGTGVMSSMPDRQIQDVKPLFSELGSGVMSSMPDHEIQDIKPLFSDLGTAVMSVPNVILHHRDYMFLGPPDHVDYVKDTWINYRDRFLHVFPENPYNALLAEASVSHHMQMAQQPHEQPSAQEETGPGKKTSGANAKPPKIKKPKNNSSLISRENRKTKIAKRSIEVVINGIDMDIGNIPTPVCSCTGTPQQCYRWGGGGWQSACCTTTISMYPLPMNTKRRGARIAGRKMSLGAFKKVLEKLSADGFNFDNIIDLKTHWAKHGTNKFVTIR